MVCVLLDSSLHEDHQEEMPKAPEKNNKYYHRLHRNWMAKFQLSSKPENHVDCAH